MLEIGIIELLTAFGGGLAVGRYIRTKRHLKQAQHLYNAIMDAIEDDMITPEEGIEIYTAAVPVAEEIYDALKKLKDWFKTKIGR